MSWEPRTRKTHDMSYFVPNFGKDEHMVDTMENLDLAEQITGHKWQWVDPKHRPKPHDVDYFVPNFGPDEDVK